MKELAFYLGLGTLFTHELDAVVNHEWRLLPVLNQISDDMGMTVFLLAHIPLFAVLIALVASSNPRIRRNSRLFIGAFLVLHAPLHTLFVNHPEYSFTSPVSAILIYGGAVLGALYLALEFAARPDRSN
jgi:hypothetical protein